MRAIGASWLVALVLVSAGACSLFTDSGGLADTNGGGDAGAFDAPSVTEDAPKGAVDVAASSDGAHAADANPYRDAVLADHPLAYWPFDDGVGSSFAIDVVAGVPAAVVTAATFGVSGAVGSAVSFDGSGHLSVGDHFDFVGAAPYSIEFWAKPPPPDHGFHNVLEKRGLTPDGGLTGYVTYFSGDTTLAVNVEEWAPNGENRGGWGDLSQAGFVHVVWTFDGSNVQLYGDSIRLATTYDNAGGPIDNTSPLVIAGSYVGVLDELALYDHALSIDRVRAHFERGHK